MIGWANTGKLCGSAAVTSASPGEQASEPPFGRGNGWLGLGIIVLFFGALFAWTWIAPLESAVVATGVITADTNTKTIQHLEGGIIRDIMVRDGDAVRAGDLLIKLEATRAALDLNEVQAQYVDALATQMRLLAERDGLEKLTLPKLESVTVKQSELTDALANQQSILSSRRTLFVQRRTILQRTVAGLEIEIEGLEGLIRSAQQRRALVDDELSVATGLLKKGLTDRPRVLALQRQKAEIEGSISTSRAAIGVARQKIEEARLRQAELEASALSEIVKDLEAARTRAYELAQRVAAAKDVVVRSEIRSPIDGIVAGLKVHTRGGVVGAGQPLLEIVPNTEELVVQASVDALDIDQVHAGLPATVWLWAANRRNRAAIDGVVTVVSADRVVDPNTGFAYYPARVELKPSSLQPSAVTLQPGMSADVMIRTGARSAWEYISAPIARSISRAMREE